MEEKWSYFSLRPLLRNSRFGGYCALDRSCPPRHLYVHKIFMKIVLIDVVIFMIQHVIKAYQARNDINTLVDTMFLLFTYLGSIYKQVVMTLKADEVQELLNTMKGDVFNQTVAEHHKLHKATAREAKNILNIYNVTAVVTCFLMALYLHILFSQGKHVEFTIWFPFEPDTNPKYDLENFVDNCKIKSRKLGIPLTKTYDTMFKNMAIHFLEINKFFTRVEATYSRPIFCQFLFGAWILCTTGYRLVEIDKTSLACFTIILFLMCILTQLILFCFYGSRLTDASEKLLDSAYFLDWVEIPMKNKRDLVLFMEMLKKPITPTAGSIAPLSNTTFVSIIRSSYSFYAFLKNTEN